MKYESEASVERFDSDSWKNSSMFKKTQHILVLKNLFRQNSTIDLNDIKMKILMKIPQNHFFSLI